MNPTPVNNSTIYTPYIFVNVTVNEDVSSCILSWDPWWNINWDYRQEINLSVSSGSTPTNYQTKIIVNSSNVGSNFDWSRDCADMRFIDSSNTIELDFWIESCDDIGEEAIVWVEVDDNITTAEAPIYMYYGNDAASSASDGTSTFLFYDDFDDIPDGSGDVTNRDIYWYKMQPSPGENRFVDGVMISDRTDGTYGAGWRTPNITVPSSMSFLWRAKINNDASNPNDFRINFGDNRSANEWGTDDSSLIFNIVNDAIDRWSVQRESYSVWDISPQGHNFPGGTGSVTDWHTYRTKVTPDLIKVYQDKTFLSENTSLPAGGYTGDYHSLRIWVSLWSFAGGAKEGHTDWFAIGKYTAIEPAYDFGDEESQAKDTTNYTMTAVNFGANTYAYYNLTSGLVSGTTYTYWVTCNNSLGAAGSSGERIVTYLALNLVSSCTEITQPGYFSLTNSLSGVRSGGNECILISANNVIFDCSGKNIIGDGNPTAIKLNSVTNVTVKDCNINNYNYGIDLFYSDYNNIEGNFLLYSEQEGIRLDNSDYNNISDNLVHSSGINIFLYGASNNLLIDNEVADGNIGFLVSETQEGLSLQIVGSVNNTFINNSAINNDWDFYLQLSSENNLVTNLDLFGTVVDFEASNIALKKSYLPGARPYNYGDIREYVEVGPTGDDPWIFINISYDEYNVDNLEESQIAIAKYNGSWELASYTFTDSYGVNEDESYVWANITTIDQPTTVFTGMSEFLEPPFPPTVDKCQGVYSLGIAIQPMVIGEEKVESFMNSDYTCAKNILGLWNYEFYLELKYFNETFVEVNGTPVQYGKYPTADAKVFTINRPALYKIGSAYEEVKLTMGVWIE